jgi:EAL domain-containing protein (putative c-di-GMP-specific phosphodiesterase class I)/ActR/RegA family two-component response regulator
MAALIIDDDAFARSLLSRQLSRLGVADIRCFERAPDALAALQAHGCNDCLILCDLQMPEMDGIELIRQLGQLGYNGALALISGEDRRILQTAERLAAAHCLNVLGALQKPVALDRLRDLLQRWRTGIPASQPARAAPGRIYRPEDLRRGIAAGELVCHFQPKVNRKDGDLAGVECLARWQHPADGLVFPDQFVPLAERTGLIDDLTQAVLEQALRQARTWQDAGLRLDIAVNVSMANLLALDFPNLVAGLLATTGIAPERLVLEVTESQLMRDRVVSLDILTRLRLKHVGLSIDDFGTGHSSLAQLRDVPFSELKIDRGFVHGAVGDPALQAMFDASLGIARQLGLKTVAEGVEDTDDWLYIRGTDCDMIQGYLVGRPMPGPDLPGWRADWARRYRALP